MKLKLIILTMLIAITAFSCESKEKQKKIKTIKSPIRYYDNGNIAEEYHILENNDSVYIEFYDNGNKKTEYKFSDGILNGYIYCFFDNGDTLIIGNNTNGKEHGIWKTFDKNHKLWQIIEYQFGKIIDINMWDRNSNHVVVNGNGRFVKYYENGKIETIVYFVNNQMDGEYIQYYDNGNIELKGNYQDGAMIGIWKYYDLDGNLEREEDMDKNRR